MQALHTPQLGALRVHPRLDRRHTIGTVSRRAQQRVQLQRRNMAPVAVIQQQPDPAEQLDEPRRVAIFVVRPQLAFGQLACPGMHGNLPAALRVAPKEGLFS